MSPELDDALCRDFPLLYRQRHGSMRETLMCWGFECGPGWEPLIRRLSEKLEPYIAAMEEDPDMGRPCADQVKEKYATLCYYMSHYDDQIEAWIDEAEAESAVTCEKCGQPGVLRGKGWLSTRCDECWVDNR